MAPQSMDPLSGLRDIHLPDPISAWPPAPGWWCLTILSLFALGITAYRLYWRHRNNRYRRLALQRLGEIDYRNKNQGEYLQAINHLLKQTVLAASHTKRAAGLTGSAWLEFLDRTGGTREFSQGAGKALLNGPYSSTHDGCEESVKQIHQLVGAWIRGHDITRGRGAC